MGSQAAAIVEVGQSTLDSGDLLNSWREIARYLNRGIRTVQRWEAELALPVRRPRGKTRTAVIARRSEIENWLNASPGSVSDRNCAARRIEAYPDPECTNVVHPFSLLSSQVRADLGQLQLAFRKNMEDFIRVEV